MRENKEKRENKLETNKQSKIQMKQKPVFFKNYKKFTHEAQ